MVTNLNKKPRIAIIIDKEGWAFFYAAEQIKRYLSKYYEIDIIPMDLFGDNVIKLFILGSEYDIMFFMWRGIISWLYSEYSKSYIYKLGFEYEEFIEEYVNKKCILTGVYDHLFINSETERTEFILNNVKNYIVCSKKLEKIYKEYPHYKKPSKVISDGVDLDLFKMTNTTKYDSIESREIQIGWTGNSKFTDEQDDDLKGLNKIIKPAISDLVAYGYPIKLNIADRNIKKIPHDQMPHYYNNIDIYVCASRTEGHPAPVLEAMACGVPVISTDVGIVKEVFGNKQKDFIIKRTKEDLKQKIIELIKNKSKLKELSCENLNVIKSWSWEKQANLYMDFFEQNLK